MCFFFKEREEQDKGSLNDDLKDDSCAFVSVIVLIRQPRYVGMLFLVLGAQGKLHMAHHFTVQSHLTHKQYAYVY